MTQVVEKTELGLLTRLIAAAWFGLAACVPVIFFFLTFGGVLAHGPGDLDLRILFFFGEIPIVLAALFGFSFGVRILDPVRRTSPTRATLRGLVGALLSYVVFIAVYIVQTQTLEPGPVIGFALLVIVIGSIWMVWPVALSGALAGWWLCHLACRPDFWDWLLNQPRISARTASAWIGVSVLLVLFNCAVGMYALRPVNF